MYFYFITAILYSWPYYAHRAVLVNIGQRHVHIMYIMVWCGCLYRIKTHLCTCHAYVRICAHQICVCEEYVFSLFPCLYILFWLLCLLCSICLHIVYIFLLHFSKAYLGCTFTHVLVQPALDLS